MQTLVALMPPPHTCCRMQVQAPKMIASVTAGYWGAGQPGNQRSDNFAAYKALVDSGISLIDTAEASSRQLEVDGLWCCADCGVTACWVLQQL